MSIKFPSISAKDLNGKMVNMPQDFMGDTSLILIAYDQWHQNEVDTWVPLADQLEAEIPGFHYYELPLVGNMGWFGQKQLDYWMRTGIQNPVTRGRTITLYTDQAAFRRQLDIPHQDHIALVLLDENHDVIWRAYGPINPTSANELNAVLAQTALIE